MRPRIAISCGFIVDKHVTEVGLDYSAGVEEAGGLPLVLPVPFQVREKAAHEADAFAAAYAADVLDAVDGLLVPGGWDIDPEYFGEAPIPALGKVEPARDRFEMALVRAALAKRLPLMGICRGLQLLAVATGGTLYQDLCTQKPAGLKHQCAPNRNPTHHIEVEPGTFLAERLGAGKIKVNSRHHQAIARPPHGFRISASASDGVIEAIESVATSDPRAPGFAFGVQFHPENLWVKEPVFLKLFTGFVETCARHRKVERP